VSDDGRVCAVTFTPPAGRQPLMRRMPWPGSSGDAERLVTREWLVTNGLGGYASGTVSGVITRRYHGLLVAALPAPHGRTVMLSHVAERLRLADRHRLDLSAGERVGSAPELHGLRYLREFRLEDGLPVWTFEAGDAVIEKRLLLPHRQNTVHLTYRLLRGEGPVRLDLRPSVHFRHHEAPVSAELAAPYPLTVVGDRYEIAGGALPPLRLMVWGHGGTFTVEGHRTRQVLYRMEETRGYESAGDLWSPGFFRVWISAEAPASLVASTDSWEALRSLPPADAMVAERERRDRLITAAPPELRTGAGAELVLAADQFIIAPAGRLEDVARARAAGDDVRTVIAGYHWFTDWGRDTMISLEGLTIATGRHLEAGFIVRTFADYVRDGLLPNMFPDGQNEGLYHTADATLWYFHAVDRYLQATGDRVTLVRLLPVFLDIVSHHLAGTRFGIRVDADGLLTQGAEGYQLTWMDAKVDGWVVTPRRGKAVEINALWYNALRLLAGWLHQEGDARAAGEIEAHAERTRAAFNRRFWFDEGGYLFDVVDGEDGRDDAACRPNQVLAVSLTHPVLDPARWARVVEVVRERLLTPVGLRSLAPGHPDYKPTYHGDLRTRDAAYHQGTVWAWLVGPMVDAWLRVWPEDREGARRLIDGIVAHLDEACVGSVSEIFDAESPYTPRGCVAQAWSVAEALRSILRTSTRDTEHHRL
jgi:predicted glycogen debranching enzyme